MRSAALWYDERRPGLGDEFIAEVSAAWQNAFSERKNALSVESFELAGVALDPRERELLAQFLGVTVIQALRERPRLWPRA